MAEGLTWAGVDVASWALRVRDLSGLLAIPGRRGENVAVAGRDGTIRTPRKTYLGREFVLEFLIRGADADGLVPSGGAAEQFYRNADLLAQLCAQDVATLAHTLPDGTVRQLEVEVLNTVEPDRYKAGSLAVAKVALTSASAWWRAAAATVITFSLADNGTRQLVELEGMSGRIDDALVTFANSGNNPTLTQVETGIGIGYDEVFSSGKSMRLGDYSWLAGGGLVFARTKLRTSPLVGSWWVLDPVPDGVPTVQLDLTGGGPMTITISARQSWGMG